MVNRLTLNRTFVKIGTIKGMDINFMAMRLNEEQLQFLNELKEMADIVILPFPVLTALREQNVRDSYPNCLAFNATVETQRLPPNEKIVDINNWSY